MVKYGRMSPVSGSGRRRSRSHQTAWLVCAGDAPKMRSGSQRTRHSHKDHKCESEASKRRRGGGVKGDEEARIWDALRINMYSLRR
jgi:hypothetical protein